MKKGRRLLLWPPFNSISLPTEQEAEPREVGEGGAGGSGRRIFSSEGGAAGRSDCSLQGDSGHAEQRRAAQTAAAESLQLEDWTSPPPTLRDWRGPDGWRATAAPPSEQSLHGGASQQRALPPSCVQTGNALIADCTVLWICMQTDTAKYISGCSRRATLSPRCSARPGQICCSNTVFFNKYIQTEIKAPLPNPQARQLANRRGRAILIFPSPQCWGIALQLFWSFSITLLRWR